MTSADFLERTVIPHLRDQLKQAAVVLFTGAGFSASTKNLSGDTLPTAQGLSRLLWGIAYPSRDPDPRSSLPDIYEAALNTRPKEVERVVRTALTIDSQSIDDWILLYYRQPWHKAYTLNIDSLVSALNQRRELPRELVAVSAMSESPPKDYPPHRFLKAVHLNGVLDDLPHNVTFSHTQYAQRLAEPDRTYQELSAEIMGRPFVFAGTNIEESPLWQSIERRLSKGPRGYKENRPRSYLVMPRLDPAKRDRLAAFNISWLRMTAEEFATRVLERLDDAAETGFGSLASAASAGRNRLQEVSELLAEPTAPSRFLLGAEPLWSDVQSGNAITRSADSLFFKEALDRLSATGTRGILALTGTAGTGKTTSLMALSLRLLSEGHRVAWVDDSTDISARRIVEEMRAPHSSKILAIDEGETYGTSLSYLLSDLVRLESNPLVLVSIRSGRVDRVLDPFVLKRIPYKELGVPHLVESEIEDLIDLLDRKKRLGVLRGLPRAKQREAFLKHAERQLLVAMIRATSGKKLEEKIGEEYDQLTAEAKTIYATVSLSTHLGYPLTRDEILQAVPGAANIEMETIKRLRSRHLLLERPPHSGRLQARHRVVAEHLVELLRIRGELPQVVEALGRFAARLGDSNSASNRAGRLRTRIINHEFVYRSLDRVRGRMFYDGIEPDLAEDFHYWLQRGSFEVKYGDLYSAENFLGQAKGLAPGDLLVANEWAYCQFRKANANPQSEAAHSTVTEATTILRRLMENPRTSEYPFHVLGSQGLIWSRKASLGTGQRGPYLRGLIADVEKGVKRFPRSNKLKGLLKALEKEHLEVALSAQAADVRWPGQRP